MGLFTILGEKPWQPLPAGNEEQSGQIPAQRVGLLFFLGVVGVLFSLFMVAYFIRMELDDWRPMPESPQLWINTLILFAASVALQWTQRRLAAGEFGKVRSGLILGGVLSLAFVLSQLGVWYSMSSAGYALNNNPANAFFYLLTGIHGLHLLGGLWVWTRATLRLYAGATLEDIRLSVELCSLYWHFLLLVWLVVFALLSYT